MGGVNLRELLPSASRDAISLLSSLCSGNPHMTPTAAEAFEHPFFWSCYFIPQSEPLLYNNFEAIAFPTAIATKQGRSLAYSQETNGEQLFSCFVCEMKRTNNNHMIIKTANPATSMIYKIGYATTTDMLASRLLACSHCSSQ